VRLTFESEYEVAPGVLVRRTGGPGHSVVRLTSRGERLMFLGDSAQMVGAIVQTNSLCRLGAVLPNFSSRLSVDTTTPDHFG
jgi:hypothetical protein